MQADDQTVDTRPQTAVPPDSSVCGSSTSSTSSTYYALLFLPPAQRRVAAALHAFNHEVNRVADTCQYPGVAAAKLAWWQEEVARLFSLTSASSSALPPTHPTQPTHPITRTLAAHLHSHLLPCGIRVEHLLAMVEGGRMNVNQSRYLDWPALRTYCRQTAGVWGHCIARICSVEDTGENTQAALLAAAEKLALAVQVTHIIRNVGQDARHGRIYLPVAELQQFGVKAADILHPPSLPPGPPLVALMQFQARRVRQLALEAVQILQTGAPAAQRATRGALRPHLALAVLAHALLAEIERDGWQVLAQRTSLTPLRKCWLAWRVWASGGRYAVKRLQGRT